MSVLSWLIFAQVDDTVDGIREGLAAGCWTVGVAKTVGAEKSFKTLEESQTLYVLPPH